jgi:hypothetical protein
MVLMPLAGINGLAWEAGAKAMMALDVTIARINPRMVFPRLWACLSLIANTNPDQRRAA